MGLLSLLPVIGNVLDKILPDKKSADAAKLALLELQQKGDLAVLDAASKVDVAQAAINQEEAKSNNFFISGWRVFCGWIGALGLAWTCILANIIQLILDLNGINVKVPTMENDILLTVIMGMLGLSTTRTYEKMKGISIYK
jgi:hypothetical protein